MKIYRIPKTAKLISILFLLIALSTVTGCMPGDGKHSAEKPAGFLWGMWHGLIALISLIWGILATSESMNFITQDGGMILGFVSQLDMAFI